MSLSSTDKGLLTPGNCAVIFIDHQPQMFLGVANLDRQDLLNNVLVLAKAARIFHVPVILTAVESGAFSGNITPPVHLLIIRCYWEVEWRNGSISNMTSTITGA